MSNDERQYRALLKGLEDRFTEPIYHYTGAEGLNGVLTTNEIWLTNAGFVNDTTECKAFLEDCARDLLQDERLRNEYVREKLQFRLEDGPENADYYIASFSGIPDSLSQYRGYGEFCIGYDLRKMSGRRYHLYRCVYKRKDIIDWVCRKAMLRQWNATGLQEDSKRGAAHDLVFAAAVKYKNIAYRDEREIRMVAVSGYDPAWNALLPLSMPVIHANDPPVHSRVHSGHPGPVPYVKFFLPVAPSYRDLRKDKEGETMAQMKRRRLREESRTEHALLPITEVWVGPMARQAEAKRSCEIMLQEKGYEDVQVHESEIPYRGV